MKLSWELKPFDDLLNKQLYDILQLRSEVFVVEQNCPYQDADGKDLKSFHLMGRDRNGILMAYSRILPAGISYKEPSIGRVVSSPKVRGTGAGKELMEQSISAVEKIAGRSPIKIGAQLYLKKFYESFGFVVSGDQYMEDGIPHIEMLRP